MTDLSSQLGEALAGRYLVERVIGRGGMATVYLARDTRHDRHVAVKMLDPELTQSLGGERFLAEIRVTAQLQHPNILALFDSGTANGLLYYVMPFVPGETLRARLERERQLPVSDAIRIASGVAAALEHAHRHGIVHRDLKPENILLADGEPLVADFGIALALSRAAADRLTLTGLSLGTPAYMSPEQATGDRVIDGRSDLFSLGCIAYEMLAGESPFAAAAAPATIARVITGKPRPLSAVRPSVPPHVDAAIERALEKLPADRWASARDFAAALGGERPVVPRAPSVPSAHRPLVRWLPWVIAATASVVGAISLARRPNPAVSDMTLRFPIVTSDSERFIPTIPAIPFAISNDDRRIVYIGTAPGGGNSRLYVRGLDDMQTHALAGSEGALNPTFSPDGQWIAFVAEGRIVKIPVGGGAVTPLASLGGASNGGLLWPEPDTLLGSIGGALAAIPASGGQATVLSRPDTARGEVAQWGPRIIDDRFIAYTSASPVGVSGNRVGVLDRATHRATITSLQGTTVLGVIDRHLLWVAPTGSVLAATVEKSGIIGPPASVLEGVLVRGGGAAKATLSLHGSLLYQRGEAMAQLVSVDEHGSATPLGIEPRAYWHPRWSPDGSRIAVEVMRSGRSDIWVIDAHATTFSRLTSEDGLFAVPAWTPDGSRILYRAGRPSGTTLEWQRAEGSDSSSKLVGSPFRPYDGSISLDGRWILFRMGEVAPTGIFYAPLRGGAAPVAIVATRHYNVAEGFSPDSRAVAYASDELGRMETFVRPFPGPGARVQVSVGGGTEPVWSHDGRTLYYRAGRTLMAATIATAPALAVAGRRALFDGAYLADAAHADYDVAPDGKHFLMLQAVDRQAETLMIYGWANELRRAWAGERRPGAASSR